MLSARNHPFAAPCGIPPGGNDFVRVQMLETVRTPDGIQTSLGDMSSQFGQRAHDIRAHSRIDVEWISFQDLFRKAGCRVVVAAGPQPTFKTCRVRSAPPGADFNISSSINIFLSFNRQNPGGADRAAWITGKRGRKVLGGHASAE